MNWNTIETAPKDGTEILVFDAVGIHKVAWLDNSVGRYSKTIMCWCIPMSWQDEQGGYSTIDSPTHWMSLLDLGAPQ